jgi:3-deoxy-D-manno-octulosonic-acid transferase
MFVYNLLIRLYGLVILTASLRKTKAKQWVVGRKNWKTSLNQKISKLSNEKRIWVHCASYGEFEQGRPVIEAIKNKHPDHKIILTFFSPSGYEPFKEWKGADVIAYLPLDTYANACDFIEIVKPKAVIFIKYEFWVNFLFRLKQQNIPTFLVSAVFKPHHPFFRWYGGVFRRSLQTFTQLFIQDENSASLLKTIGVTNYEVCGDTRFDRVLDIKENFIPIPFFEEFCKGKKVIVAGSTWPKDDELILEAFQSITDPQLKLILVPHNIEQKSIHSLEQMLEKKNVPYFLYSAQKVDASKKVMVVDAMGLLSRLYHYANVAYIGGGFNSGIHNCLEPAVYLKPVVFYGGDDYDRYNEAVDLLKMNAAKNVANSEEMRSALAVFLNEKEEIKNIEVKLQAYLKKNSGTTKRVLEFINWNE